MTVQLNGLPAIDVPDNPDSAFWIRPVWLDEGEDIDSIVTFINWNERDLNLAVSVIEDFFIENISYEELETRYQPFFPPD